ncbi:MAG: D-aminoacyl-tRNA deacylase [Pseudomonadota bacterium]
MRAVIQRVKNARVKVNGRIIGSIGPGLLLFLGIGREDTHNDADYLVDKSINLRIFEDKEGKLNLSLLDVAGEMLVVSQFTLMADCRQGRRPSFSAAQEPERAKELYLYFIRQVKEKGVSIATGEFQSIMDVNILNHGPVTVLLDSKKAF